MDLLPSPSYTSAPNCTAVEIHQSIDSTSTRNCISDDSLMESITLFGHKIDSTVPKFLQNDDDTLITRKRKFPQPVVDSRVLEADSLKDSEEVTDLYISLNMSQTFIQIFIFLQPRKKDPD
ncbi:hypothetical protein ZOSMA_8G01900 [Zostera marina]|uniref:Uncharacterized protein n=1 Tax=Zostera marina TaxID=29655 RepID=A0A0K9NJU7_ZOSMR|nr:hypothetical protein ZOSMA_8G01900 [Zostera marina]